MKTANFEIVNTIVRRGNEPGLITEWFRGMLEWANTNPGPDATALRTWLEMVKPRPFYTTEELCALWPALRVALGYDRRMIERPSPNRLANELAFHGLQYLASDEGTYYFRDPFTGKRGRYFIVERHGFWRKQRLSQKEFDYHFTMGCPDV